MELIELIDKYLVEGMPHGNAPSLDSLKYKPQGKSLTADELEDLAKRFGKGKSKDITANVAWAMKKNDKKRVRELVDKFPQYIIGISDVLEWLGK